MEFSKFFRRKRAAGAMSMPITVAHGRLSAPIPPEHVEGVTRAMAHRREWRCANTLTKADGTVGPCDARLAIRCKDARQDGPSNYVPHPAGHPYAGHSQVRSQDLTWDGMAAERGWTTDPVVCPACQQGMSVTQYKDARRQGLV